MTQLQKLYQTIQNLKELGYPLDEKMLRDLDQLEEALIEKEVLPALANTIAPTLSQIQRELTLEVTYVPDEPLGVRLIRETNGEWARKAMQEMEAETGQPEDHERRTFTMSPHTKRGKTGLEVTFPDGTKIHERFAYQTMMEAIRKIGHTRVQELGFKYCGVPLISDTRDDFYPQHELSPGVLIMTHSATKTKKEMLDEVSEKLGLGLEVKIV